VLRLVSEEEKDFFWKDEDDAVMEDEEASAVMDEA